MNAQSVSRALTAPCPRGTAKVETLITFQRSEVPEAETFINLPRSGVQKAETFITFQRPEVPKAETFIIFEAAWVSFKVFQHSHYSGEFHFKANQIKPKQQIENPA